MAKKYFGVIPPIPTPIDEHEKVDETALRNLVDYTVESGVHGIFVAGSNGECMGLTQGERDRAIQIVLDQCADRLPVMAGVMDTSTARVIDNIKRLEQMGGTAAVVTPMFYARYSIASETVRHFEEISRATSADLLIYNIPGYTYNPLKAETVFELAKIDKVAGYKDSSNTLGETIKCIEHFKGTDFSVLQGMVQSAAATILLGGDGFVPSIATAFPKVCLKVYQYASEKNIEKTMFWNGIMNDCMKICGMSANGTCATKCMLSATGLFSERVTRPLEPVTESEKANILAKTRELMAYVDSLED